MKRAEKPGLSPRSTAGMGTGTPSYHDRRSRGSARHQHYDANPRWRWAEAHLGKVRRRGMLHDSAHEFFNEHKIIFRTTSTVLIGYR